MCGFPRATRGWHVFPLRSKGGLTSSNQPSAEEKPEKPALLAGQAQLPHVKGAVTKWLIILLQPLFCVFISSFLALL